MLHVDLNLLYVVLVIHTNYDCRPAFPRAACVPCRGGIPEAHAVTGLNAVQLRPLTYMPATVPGHMVPTSTILQPVTSNSLGVHLFGNDLGRPKAIITEASMQLGYGSPRHKAQTKASGPDRPGHGQGQDRCTVWACRLGCV